VFEGSYEHRLDDKDRLTIPGRFRAELGRRFYITRGHEDCLYVLTEAHYTALARVIASAAQVNSAGQEGQGGLEPSPPAISLLESPGDILSSIRATFNNNVRVLQRHFYGDSFEASTDAQGRVTLPASLRRYAGIDRDIVVVGVGDRLELWSPERWLAETDDSREKVLAAAQGMGLN
jgi:MraZ protein